MLARRVQRRNEAVSDCQQWSYNVGSDGRALPMMNLLQVMSCSKKCLKAGLRNE
jgi:hypothetical protein